MSHLVIVHGMGGKPAQDVLRESCRFFLEGSTATQIPADRLRLAYWADLAGYPAEVDDRGSFRPYTAAERLAIAAGGLVKERAIGVVEAKLSEALHREAAPNNAEAAALAGLLAFVTGPVTLLLLKEFLRDVYVYFRGGIREPVKDRVRAQLDAVPAGSRVGLIGHSLGTVVALDVLASDGRRVDRLWTLGSPLGFQAIQTQMGVNAATLSGVATRWDNLADRIDPVALDETLANDFPNVGVTDGLIVNEFVNAAGHRNAHRLYGYLHAPPTGRLVREFLQAG
jgi:hypothetical protein